MSRCDVDGCERKYFSSGYCNLHFRRFQATGDPLGTRLPTLEQRIWTKIDRRGPDDCWEWTGARDENGYGRIRHEGEKARAHRLVYEITHGPLPEDLFIRHRCDNPPCVNPAHLEPGTHQDNMDDTVRRLRRPRKWTDDQLEAIRTDPRPAPVIAAAYGMSLPYVYVVRKHYRHGMNRSL